MPISIIAFQIVLFEFFLKKKKKRGRKKTGIMPCTFFCTLYCEPSYIILGIVMVTHEQVKVWAYCESLADDGV